MVMLLRFMMDIFVVSFFTIIFILLMVLMAFSAFEFIKMLFEEDKHGK